MQYFLLNFYSFSSSSLPSPLSTHSTSSPPLPTHPHTLTPTHTHPQRAVRAMRAGSVIVDLAAEQGGNCELTRPSEAHVDEESGVTVIGYVLDARDLREGVRCVCVSLLFVLSSIWQDVQTVYSHILFLCTYEYGVFEHRILICFNFLNLNPNNCPHVSALQIAFASYLIPSQLDSLLKPSLQPPALSPLIFSRSYTDLPSRMAAQASELYATNICHMLDDLKGGWNFHLNLADEIFSKAVVVHRGEIVWSAAGVCVSQCVSVSHDDEGGHYYHPGRTCFESSCMFQNTRNLSCRVQYPTYFSMFQEQCETTLSTLLFWRPSLFFPLTFGLGSIVGAARSSPGTGRRSHSDRVRITACCRLRCLIVRRHLHLDWRRILIVVCIVFVRAAAAASARRQSPRQPRSRFVWRRQRAHVVVERTGHHRRSGRHVVRRRREHRSALSAALSRLCSVDRRRLLWYRTVPGRVNHSAIHRTNI